MTRRDDAGDPSARPAALADRPGGLPARFGDHVRRHALLDAGDHVLVALSGGLDSVVLLHLLRFHPPAEDLRLTAAHLDHRMRPGSSADARWVAGLARAWEVGLRSARAEAVPRNEAEARSIRYAFLREAADGVGAGRLATGHHADDQAETVLFRTVRGSGIRGLRGIRETGQGGLVRPLLPFWRRELEAYAHAVGLNWRRDPTNRATAHARNVLRHRVIPLLEAEVAPGARRALVRLARNARREDQAWRSLLPRLLDGVVQQEERDRIVMARDDLLAFPPAVRARLLRELARRLGVVLDEAGTRVAIEFTTSGPSGGGVDLARGLRLRRDFDRLAFIRREGRPLRERPDDSTLTVPGPGSGSGRVTLGGRTWAVRWGPTASARWTAAVAAGSAFPLVVRSWRSGDRIRLAYGRKKLAKVFAEARVPVPERGRRPVLVDAHGTVLWVPGLAQSVRAAPEGREGPEEPLMLGIDDADTD